MKAGRATGMLAIAALLSACGGGGGDGGDAVAATPTPTAGTGACSLRARQDWAAAQLDEWYLFPETLPTARNPGAYADVQEYVDALTATARAQSKDRYFTYVTSIAAEDAYYESGATAGFGLRLSYGAAGELYVSEAFEGAPALAAGIDRGARIVAIGTSAATLRDVAALRAEAGEWGVAEALGPDTAGTTRVLRVADAAGTRDVTLAKASYEVSPVSSRYGARVLDDGGRRVGYVNLRTFIGTANDQLRSAFAGFRAQGITQVIVDLRYNGGGLISTAELFTDLLGGNRSGNDVQAYTSFRPSKSQYDETRTFQPQAQSIAPTRVAFIGTEGTASASEYVINALVPYLHGDVALVGTDTYGKPVGQIARDREACDDRLRVIAFALKNAARRGDYYTGLAGAVEASCQASDDLSRPLGDAAEGSVRAALDFLAGRGCTPIGATAAATRAAAPSRERTLLTPRRPSPAQREVPGLF